MEPVGRRTFFLLSPLIVLSVTCPEPTRTTATETPSFLLATTAPSERPSSSATWVDDLDQRVKTYFTKKYPAYDFEPYEQELDRIRSASNRGDQWGVKREMGVFLQMLVSHAYGLGDDAAEELAVISNRIMPEQEFGIIYPGSESRP
jgi:hypothetical protein